MSIVSKISKVYTDVSSPLAFVDLGCKRNQYNSFREAYLGPRYLILGMPRDDFGVVIGQS